MFKLKEYNDCEQIYSLNDRHSGLNAIIAIHNTTLGPAIGGCRLIDASNEDKALPIVMKLAKSMTYKSVMAHVNYGGGKSIIVKPKGHFDRKILFKTFGKFVNSLGGKYITAIDSGSTMKDMDIVSQQTPYVTGYTQQNNNEVLDPSYYTAQGVLASLFSAMKYRYNSVDLSERKILVKGIGNVGYHLVKLLYMHNAKTFVSDIDVEKCKRCESEFQSTIINPENIFNSSYDIICPCDIECTVTEANIQSINTSVLVGATNNQLENDNLAEKLARKKILYCPDYIVNSGGLIYVTKLYENKSLTNIMNEIKKLADTTEEVLKYADTKHLSTKAAADEIAERRIEHFKLHNLIKESVQA